jgi:hypothetical protein
MQGHPNVAPSSSEPKNSSLRPRPGYRLRLDELVEIIEDVG